jgi:hypothetical protein
MAGSRKKFQYTNDAGVLYTVNLDESNSEGTIGGTAMFLPRTTQLPDVPRGTKLRYCNAYLLSNPDIKRKFYIGNPAAVLQAVNGGALLAAVYPSAADAAPVTAAWGITSYRGEGSTPPQPINTTSGDTGLFDGDAAAD